MIVSNVTSPLFKGEPEIKVKNPRSNGTDEAGSYCNLISLCKLMISCKYFCYVPRDKVHRNQLTEEKNLMSVAEFESLDRT